MKAILGSLRALIRPWGAHMSGSQSLGLDKTKLWGVAGLGLDLSHRKMVLANKSDADDNTTAKEVFWAVLRL